ncbi:MAG: alpha/beta hydrolase family protein [Candidatus Glassbacteria bacterium]
MDRLMLHQFRPKPVVFFLSSALALVLLASAVSLAAGGEADPFTVIRPPLAEGKRITPLLSYQINMAWQQDDLRRTRLGSIRNENELLAWQRELREKLLASLGGFPAEKTPLNPRITGTLQVDGYRIDKLVFESLPGFHVTALVYVPDGPVVRRPAVLVACGHSQVGKAHPAYQQISARLARRGYVVICWDPVGQGERSQYWDAEKLDSRYNRVCGEHAILGDVAYLAGASLARWEIWDGVRALDYLVSRPDVDPARICVTGTSGGGFQCAFIMALDSRIHAAAPSCYISSLPMRMANRIFTDPDNDPEQDLYCMVSSGIDHPGLCFLTYPRPLVLSMAVEDFFPIEGGRKTFREVEEVYRRFGHPDRIALTEGYHPHSFSSYNQLFAFGFLDRFNGLPASTGFDSLPTFEDQKLHCTASGQVRLEFPGEKHLLELVRDYCRERAEKKRVDPVDIYRGGYYPGIDSWRVEKWEHGNRRDEIGWEYTGSDTYDDQQIDRYLLHHSGMLSIPLLHVHPKKSSAGKALVWLGRRGKLSAGKWPQVKQYLDQGYDILAPDLRGQGENLLRYSVVSVDDPRLVMDFEKQYYSPLSGVMVNYIANSLLSGRPYFLQMVEDVEIVARFAAARLGLQAISVAGEKDYHTVARFAAEVLPGTPLVDSQDAQDFSWREVVEGMAEEWPVEFLLPDGAYIR